MFRLFENAPQLTLNNHFEHGFVSGQQNLFQVKLGLLSREPRSGFEEAVHCAQKIFEHRRGQAVSLCLSGGIDSEAMLQAFMAAQVQFKIYFLKFKNDLNRFDIQSNMQICDQHGLKYSVIDLDLGHFFESGRHLIYGKQYRCQSPQLAVHLWMLDQIEGLPVLGGNPFVQTYLKGRPFFIGLPGDLHCTYFRYFEQNQRAGVPWFFIYSPELCASFLRLPTPLRLGSQGLGPQDYSYHLKCKSYQEAGFEVLPRQDKFTGFELYRAQLDEKLGTANGVGFDNLYRKPLEVMNPFPEEYRQLVPLEYTQSKPE